MREFKFRIWSLINTEGKMFYPAQGLLSDLVGISNQWYVMQYTGAKDSEGVEIYSGDIDGNVHHQGLPVKCEWNSSQHRWSWYTLHNDDLYCHLGEGDSDPVVFANIHENPELLKFNP